MSTQTQKAPRAPRARRSAKPAPVAEKAYSKNPHIKLRAGKDGKYSAAGTIVPGQKPYAMTVIMDAPQAGDSFLGFPENEVSLAALGDKGAPISLEQDGTWSAIGWARPFVTEVAGEGGVKAPRTLVQVTLKKGAVLPAGRVVASIINHAQRKAQAA